MTWDDWSDKEIGFAVTAVIKDVKGFMLAKDGLELYNLSPDGMSYCSVKVIDINNPADMWPIMESNRIGTTYGSMTNSAVTVANGKLIQITDKNPLRAAAIVFLIMKGVRPDERI